MCSFFVFAGNNKIFNICDYTRNFLWFGIDYLNGVENVASYIRISLVIQSLVAR